MSAQNGATTQFESQRLDIYIARSRYRHVLRVHRVSHLRRVLKGGRGGSALREQDVVARSVEVPAPVNISV